MNGTEQNTKKHAIRDLLDSPGPCITIALAGNDSGDTNIELKDAINTVRKELESRKLDAESLLAPVVEAAEEMRTERQRAGLIVLRSPQVMEIYRMEPARPLVEVSDRFDVRALLRVNQDARSFYLLALSQNRTRILHCTTDNSEEIPFPDGFANNYAEWRNTRQPDHNLDNRHTGGVSMGTGGVLFGTLSDMDDKDEYILHFFMQLDKAVNRALKDVSDPLIPVGVEHHLALYRRVNTYSHLVEPGVHGAPDGLEGGEMHRRALELLDEKAHEPGSGIPADFDKRVGTGHASVRIPEIIAAAHEGRISQLFLQANAQYLGTYDSVRQRMKHTDDPIDCPVDLIDEAAVQTIKQGGDVKMLPGSAMPNGVPVCALFRYPAVQNSTAGEHVDMAS